MSQSWLDPIRGDWIQPVKEIILARERKAIPLPVSAVLEIYEDPFGHPLCLN